MPISVVIITKNEEHNIEDCIQSALQLTSDIIVVDCGSSDNTVKLAKKKGATIISVIWQCYGASRNAGANAAKHDWVFSLDADERITPLFCNKVKNLNLNDPSLIYRFNRKNFFLKKKIRFGTHAFDKVSRLYNKHSTQWDLFPVHEQLEKRFCRIKKINAELLHFSINCKKDHVIKRDHYAYLSAQKYMQQNKKITFIKLYLSPLFNSVKSYIFQLGFLEGIKGLYLARSIGYYTWLKYQYLNKLNKQEKEMIQISVKESLANVT